MLVINNESLYPQKKKIPRSDARDFSFLNY